MELFWGILFGGIALGVLVFLLARVILAERVTGGAFTSSEPEGRNADLDEHLERWDRAREDELP